MARSAALLILFAALNLVSSSVTSPVRAEKFTITATTGEAFAPWVGSTLPHGGLATWLVRRSLELSGYQLNEIKWWPWKRGFQATKRGDVDVTFPYGDLPSRRKLFGYSDPFLPASKPIWYRRNNNFTPESWSDLEGRKYCQPRGWADFGVLREMVDDGRIISVSAKNIDACFKMLAIGRVDFIAAEPANASRAKKDAQVSVNQISKSSLSVSYGLHVIVSKTHPNAKVTLKAFNSGLNKLRDSGELDRMKKEFNWKR